MRNFIFLQSLLILKFVSVAKSTIDMTIQDYSYIANHLTSEECRRLVASLHFLSYNLPSALTTAEEMIPEGVSCLKLLINWDGGTRKWEGKGRSHVDVANRLRQIGRPDLAVWLGNTVFLELAKEINFTLLSPSFIENINAPDDLRTHEDKELDDGYWTTLDTFLWVFVTGLSVMVMVTFCRMLYLTCKKNGIKSKVDVEQIADLLSHETVDSEQEVIYEFDIKNKTVVNKNDETLDS